MHNQPIHPMHQQNDRSFLKYMTVLVIGLLCGLGLAYGFYGTALLQEQADTSTLEQALAEAYVEKTNELVQMGFKYGARSLATKVVPANNLDRGTIAEGSVEVQFADGRSYYLAMPNFQ